MHLSNFHIFKSAVILLPSTISKSNIKGLNFKQRKNIYQTNFPNQTIGPSLYLASPIVPQTHTKHSSTKHKQDRHEVTSDPPVAPTHTTLIYSCDSFLHNIIISHFPQVAVHTKKATHLEAFAQQQQKHLLFFY